MANDSGQYLFAAVNIRKYSPANVGRAHSNQLNFLEHSEEPYNKYIYSIASGLTPSRRLKSEAMINTSHKVYIDRSLAFSRDNHVVDL